MAKASPSKRDERFRALLSSKEIRVTDQRLADLRALSSRSIPVTFPEPVEELAPQGLDRATVCLPASAVSLRGEARRRVTEVQLRGHCASCAG